MKPEDLAALDQEQKTVGISLQVENESFQPSW